VRSRRFAIHAGGVHRARRPLSGAQAGSQALARGGLHPAATYLARLLDGYECLRIPARDPVQDARYLAPRHRCVDDLDTAFASLPEELGDAIPAVAQCLGDLDAPGARDDAQRCQTDRELPLDPEADDVAHREAAGIAEHVP